VTLGFYVFFGIAVIAFTVLFTVIAPPRNRILIAIGGFAVLLVLVIEARRSNFEKNSTTPSVRNTAVTH
jgi:cytochrome c biogenesis protein CcdA